MTESKTAPRRLSEDELDTVVGGRPGGGIGPEDDDDLPYNVERNTRGTPYNDDIIGGGVNDTLAGYGGNDYINGRCGNDHLSGGDGNDDLWGEDGNDHLDGDDGNDTLHGGDGDDSISVYPNEGTDVAYGGNGTDTLCLEARPDAYRIEFTSGGFVPNGDGLQLQPGSAGTVHFAAGGSVTFSEFERITHR